MNIEHYENLVGILTRDLCYRIFDAGDKLMSLLEAYGVSVEYGDGPKVELFPGNTYRVYREEGYVEEVDEAEGTIEELTEQQFYLVNLESGMAEDGRQSWPIPSWLLSLILQHNQLHVRTYAAANAVIDHLFKGETAIKYLDGEEWGYEIFKDGQPVRKLPEGRNMP